MNFDNLLRVPQRPPSKRWSILYLAATMGGFFLTSYAEDIASRLAPGKPEPDVEAAPPIDDYPVPQMPPERAGMTTYPTRAEREQMAADGDEKYLDIETLAATDLD